jgi:transposase
MKYIQGQNRNQALLFPVCLDEAVETDNEVRLIDVFVDSLQLDDFGFRVDHIDNGRPAYHPAVLLKLYIYGYLNQMRSSRRLEKECKRNIEVRWLLQELQPDHNTIANFRRDNPKAIKKVFRETVKMAQYFELIGGVLLAGDSTKFRAQNSKKNNYNQKKIDRHIEYIENKLEEYNQALRENDGDDEDDGDREYLKKEVKKHQERKEHYHKLEKELKQSKQPQISTSDPESRQMIVRNNITEVAYNVQTTVDAQNNLLIDYKVTNTNDSKAMGNMLQRAKSILRTNGFTALYDKGYHTGSEFNIADSLGVKVMVAIPAKPRSSNAPDLAYNVEHFHYDTLKNTYTCPQGHILTTNGTWYYTENGSRFQQYKTTECKNCPVRSKCTNSKRNGKIVQRRLYAENIEANKQRIEEKQGLYRRRQAIVEHPYGTIKRQWGYCHILSKKGLNRASADVGFMMIAYNLRRILNIIGIEALREYLASIFRSFYSMVVHFKAVEAILKIYFLENKPENGFLNRPKIGYIYV